MSKTKKLKPKHIGQLPDVTLFEASNTLEEIISAYLTEDQFYNLNLLILINTEIGRRGLV